MNRSTIALLFALPLLLLSCSKKSETTSQPTPAIVGKWVFVSDSITLYKNGKLVSVDKTDNGSIGSYRQFNKDGSGIDYSPAIAPYPAYSIALTYSVTASKLTLNYPAYEAWDIAFAARSEDWEIITLTDNQLGIKLVDTEAVSGGTETTTQYFYYSK